MNRWRVLWARLRDRRKSRTLEADLDDEIRLHLDLAAADYERRGVAASEARRLAARDFGGRTQTVEAVRDRRGFPAIETVARDVRHAVRWLVRSPRFSAAAIATLALGIGANSAIFTLVDAIVLRPLPYAQADRLVALWETQAARETAEPASRLSVAPANLADLRRVRAFAGLAAYSATSTNVTDWGAPERVLGESVTADYFTILGAAPAIGRLLQASDNHAGQARVVVLSDGFWRQRFGADPGAIGRTVKIDGRAYEIVGVAAPDFRAITAFRQPQAGQFWLPITFDADLLTNRDDHEVDVVARLAPGVSMNTARAELRGLANAVLAAPASGKGLEVAGLNDDLVRQISPMILLLFGAVVLILVIACLNVANLLVIRSLAHRREIAVRLALGASRARVVSELVTQSLVLSIGGALAGIVVATGLVRLLVALAPASIPHLDRVALDARVVAFTTITAIGVGLVFGLLPLRQIAQSRPADALKASARVVPGGWMRRWRSAVLVAEVAISLALLIGAGLMVRSLLAVNRVDLGFDPDGVIAANIGLPAARYRTPDARFAFYDALATRVATFPGVTAVAFGNRLPLRGSWASGFSLDGGAGADGATPAEPALTAGFQSISPDYFRLFGIGLVGGRLLAVSDRRGAQPVALVSRNFSTAFLGGADPIGHRLRRGPEMPWITIVGVVTDIRRDGKTTPESPQVYLSAAQTDLYPLSLSDLAVRTTGDPAALTPLIRAAILAIDPEQPATNIRTLTDTVSRSLAERRFQTFLFGLFAGLAFVLSIVGVYSVVSYAVLQRRPEIGLRIALGADGPRILRWLVGQMAWLVLSGTALGLVAAVSLSRFVAALLFEVTPTDATTYVAASIVISGVALATCALVVRGATRADPTSALRAD